MELEACGLYPLALAHASWIWLMRLVFRVCDMLHVPVPAATTVTALVALSGCRTVTARVYNRGPMSPGLTRGCVILRVA
ncbi:uncharacterized protein METZ01_LOCUS379418 [marine metagenome]|uniref:Uncharacterized protein n=1 Tax=marine metagenome TaxID=408172 RepID=A0A382TWX0_9ZZZZ